MFAKKKQLEVTAEKPSCATCIYSQKNEDFDLVCKGKKKVETYDKCRKYKLDITKIANERSHLPAKKTFDKNTFNL